MPLQAVHLAPFLKLRRVLASSAAGPEDVLEAARRNVDELEALTEARQGVHDAVVRPPGTQDLTDDDLIFLAGRSGQSPFRQDWWDSVDPDIVADFRQTKGIGQRQAATGIGESLTSLRGRLKEAQVNLRELESAVRPPPAAVARSVTRQEPLRGPAPAVEATTDTLGVTELNARLEGAATPPKRPQGTAVGSGGKTPPPRRPDLGLQDDLDIPLHEPVTRALSRRWEGARAVESLEMEDWFTTGQRQMKQAQVQPTEESVGPLYRALHGMLSPDELSPELQKLYRPLKELQQVEERDMLAFLNAIDDPELQTFIGFDAENLGARMMAHPDYFPRGWNIPGEVTPRTGTRRVPRTPGLARPRVDATYDEMLTWAKSKGGGPASWDPYAMMAMRRIHGVQWRETIKMLNALRVRGKALPITQAPEGWRVPKIGPITEGHPIPLPNGSIASSEAIAVEPGLAKWMEDVWGNPQVLDFKGVATFRRWSQTAKRNRLALSGFQHIDFATRAGGVAFTPTAIARGAPLKLPSLYFDILHTTFRPGRRATLRRELLSTKPLFKTAKGEGVSPRMLIEEGWGVQGDISVIRRQFEDLIAQMEREVGSNAPAFVLERLRKTREFFEAGLFDGVYRTTHKWALENFIGPGIAMRRPNATARQVAAESAESVNLMFSTVQRWQSVLNDPILRDTLNMGLFSTVEQEGLLRSAARAFVPRSLSHTVFSEWYLGMFIFLAAAANAINLTATGKPLAPSQYNPINMNDPYASTKIPGTGVEVGIGYNNDFMSPVAPLIRGRNGQPVKLDLVGQMDTIFRWMQPIEALAARENVLPRLAHDIWTSRTFTDTPLSNPFKLAVHAALSLYTPISSENALQAVRSAVPALEGVIPESESRLGIAGNLVQATGVNVRSMPTPSVEDQIRSGALSQEDAQIAIGELYQRAITSFDRDPTFELDKTDPRTKTIAEWWAGRLRFLEQQDRESGEERPGTLEGLFRQPVETGAR